MREKTDYERFKESSPAARRLLRQEALLLEVANALALALERDGVTRSKLAERLGKSKSFVSQVLSGSRNLTLRTMADIADALDAEVSVVLNRDASVAFAVDVRPGLALASPWGELDHGWDEVTTRQSHLAYAATDCPVASEEVYVAVGAA